jgi:aminoglycoside phosphotransferase family enzyme
MKKSGDQELMKVLEFYKCYRAYVRGKVESFRLDDPHIPEGEKREALQRAKRYFDLAQGYALKFKFIS